MGELCLGGVGESEYSLPPLYQTLTMIMCMRDLPFFKSIGGGGTGQFLPLEYHRVTLLLAVFYSSLQCSHVGG